MAGVCIYRNLGISVCLQKEERFLCKIDAGDVVLESIQSEKTAYNEQLKRMFHNESEAEKVVESDAERFKESVFSGYYILKDGNVIGRAALVDGFSMMVCGQAQVGRPYRPARNEVRAKIYTKNPSKEIYQTVLKALMVATCIFHQNNILKQDFTGYFHQVDRFIVITKQKAYETQQVLKELGLQKLGVIGKGCYVVSEKGDYNVYGSDIMELKNLMIPKKASL